MSDILIRDIDPEVLARIKASAKSNHRKASVLSLAQTRRLSARWLRRLQHSLQSDSVDLIREERDSR